MAVYPETARSLCARFDSSPCVDRGQEIVVIGCDLYNGSITGGVACNMNANSNASANHAGPSVLVVEYCGDRTDASCSTEKAYCIPKNPVDGRQQAVCIPLTNRGVASEGGVFETVRAESHGALPLVCFEPLSMKEENWASKSTVAALRAQESKVARVICFTQNQREEVMELGHATGSLTAESGMHNTNYVVYPGVGITSPQNVNNPQPGDPCPTLTEDSRNYLVGKIEVGGVQPCLTGTFMGGQGAKARSIAWCADGTTPTLKSAPSGGNTIPDVVYPVNLMVATRGRRDDMRTCFGIGDANDPQFTLSSAHEHGVCYEVDEGG